MKLSIVLSTAALGFAAFAIYNHQTAQAQQERADQAASQAAALKQEVTLLRGNRLRGVTPAIQPSGQANGPVMAANKPLPAGAPAQNRCKDIASANQQLENAQQAGRAQREREFQQALKDPAARAKLIAWMKELNWMSAQEAAAELNLSETVEAQLLDMTTEQSFEVMAAAKSRSDPQAVIAAQQSLKAKHEADLIGLLGTKKYAEYQNYQKAFEQYDALRFIGLQIQMEPGQRKQILAKLIEQNISSEIMESDPDKVLSQLKPTLTAQQYKALAQSLKERD